MRVAIVVVVVIGALLLLGGGAAAYWVAGNVRVNDTVAAVNKDIDKMNAEADQLDAVTKPPALTNLGSTNSADQFIAFSQQFDTTAQQYLGQVDQADHVVTDSRSLLDDAQHRLTAAQDDWLTLFHRSSLDRERRSLAYEQQAVGVAADLVATARKQVQAVTAVVDGTADYARLLQKLDANDFSAALADYGPVHTEYAQAGQLGQGAHMPGQWDAMIGDLNKLADDSRDALQALVNGDSATAEAKAKVIDNDGKALDNLDYSSFDQDTYLTNEIAQIKALESKANSAH